MTDLEPDGSGTSTVAYDPPVASQPLNDDQSSPLLVVSIIEVAPGSAFVLHGYAEHPWPQADMDGEAAARPTGVAV